MGHGVGDCISNQLRQCLRSVLRPNSLGNAGARERRQADRALERTANHNIHHESRHACAGGVCLVESDYRSSAVERRRAMTWFRVRRAY